jgi:hypothetical protein
MAHSKDDNNSFIHLPVVVIFLSTFIFIFFIKYSENEKCVKNKLPINYIFSQSTFYSIIALLTHYLYKYLIDKDCIKSIDDITHHISEISYIPEGLFTAGIVLLVNHLSYLIYPKCEK